MRVVLHEPSNPCQPSQSTRRLVPVNDAKLRHSDREFFVASIPRIKNDTMARTIHRFQRPFLLLNVEREHVVFVVLPMSGSFPEFAVVHIRRDNSGLGV